MKLYAILIALLVIAAPASAGTKTLTVLGDKQVKLSYDGDMPKAMKAGGIKTDVTGFIINKGLLVPTYGFEASTKKKITKVQVEDVTGPSAKLLIEDLSPVISESHRWKGNAKACGITKNDVPWVFEKGASTFVFRFTVDVEGEPKPIVIYQAAVFGVQMKEYLLRVANAQNG